MGLSQQRRLKARQRLGWGAVLVFGFLLVGWLVVCFKCRKAQVGSSSKSLAGGLIAKCRLQQPPLHRCPLARNNVSACFASCRKSPKASGGNPAGENEFQYPLKMDQINADISYKTERNYFFPFYTNKYCYIEAMRITGHNGSWKKIPHLNNVHVSKELLHREDLIAIVVREQRAAALLALHLLLLRLARAAVGPAAVRLGPRHPGVVLFAIAASWRRRGRAPSPPSGLVTLAADVGDPLQGTVGDAAAAAASHRRAAVWLRGRLGVFGASLLWGGLVEYTRSRWHGQPLPALSSYSK